jgi:hypothetical protein
LIVYGVKPEIIWWGLATPTIVAAFNGYWDITYFLLGILLIVNVSVSFLLCVVLLGPCILSLSTTNSFWAYGILLVLPGLLLNVWRIAIAYRGRFFLSIVKEQGKLTIRSLVPKAVHLILLFELFLYLLISCWGNWKVGLVFFIAGFVILYFNSCVMKIADRVTIRILFLIMVIDAAFLSNSIVSIIGVLFCSFNNIFLAKREFKINEIIESLDGEIENRRNALRDYPWFNPMPLPKPSCLVGLLEALSDNSRILMECRGDPRLADQYWRFHDWTYEFLPQRNIEFINQTWLVSAFEPELAKKHLNKLNAKDLSSDELNEICCKLGVSHVITYSKETGEVFESLGYEKVRVAFYREFEELANLLKMPKYDLSLYANPMQVGVLDPYGPYELSGNKITWNGLAGQTYLLRYRYHPNFVATQGGHEIEIYPDEVLQDLSLRFMRIRTEIEGPVTLEFRSRLI